MNALITGAGQICTQLARDLVHAGHDVTVLRRGASPIPGATVISGDAGDHTTLRRAAEGATAIFHCIHAPYAVAAWRRELPQRELAVMDAGAELGIPVIFPESVYAFGRDARDLVESAACNPVSPLGEVRAELLAARASHPARTASVIASDLMGPTATKRSSAILGTVLTPAAAGTTAWVLGDPDAPHAVTSIPDLTRAMLAAVPLASTRDTRLNAPTAEARSQRQMAHDAARIAGTSPGAVRSIPAALFGLCAPFSPTTRELYHQRYLWAAPVSLRPGRLMTEFGIEPTLWEHVLREWAQPASAASTAAP